MLLESQHWHFGYEQIKTDCGAGGTGDEGQALLLCNADVDAMASARILSYMLRGDGVHYQLLPCRNYSALEHYLQTVQLDSVKAIVLLNFGAARNLTRILQDYEESLHEDVKIYVMDCRRPIHLANIYAGNNVVVFMDGTQNNEHVPSDGDNLSGNESSSSEEESESDSDSSSSSSNSSGEESKDGNQDESEEEADFDDVVDATARPPKPSSSSKGQTADYDAEGEEDHSGGGNRRQRAEVDDQVQKDGEDDDDDDDSLSPISPSKKQRTATTPSAAEDDGVTDMEQSDADSPLQAKHPPAANNVAPRELHRQRRERLRAYYSSGSFYGSPASFIAYNIATQLRFGEQGDLLWLACVGVTDAYLHARIDLTGYAELAMGLRQSCLKLFPTDMYERAINTVYAEDLASGGGRSGGGDRTKITFSDNGRIVAEKDYRFFLLRHSSLFDSMVHSDFVSTKLQVWTKKGMHKLQELLAKMGYPLEECQQPFAFMKPNLRRRLHEKIMSHSEEYGLQNFEFTSFFRVTGYQSLLSASDTSYAVTALLECETPVTTAANNTDDGQETNEDKAIVEAFNIAYDALNPNVSPNLGLNGLATEGHDAASLVNGGQLTGNTGIGAGIRLAMSMQRNIISTAVSLVDRNAINRLRHFRYAYLTCTSAGENQTTRSEMIRTNKSRKGGGSGKNNSKEDAQQQHLFAKPLALSRLAHYLMSMHRENGKWAGSKSRPLVLMAEKPQTGTYLVVGYEYPERAGMLTKNKFGMNFELTAKSMNGTFRFDSFDSNVVEVNGSDVQRFIEQLHYLMDSI